MAIFDKLFSSNDAQKVRLIRELTRFRIKTDPAAPVMGIDPDQVDSLSDSQLLMLPEASIATIVETYIQLVRRGTTVQSALSQIDIHRSSGFGSVRSAETTNIFDYVADRMRIEHAQAGALDQSFVDSAVYTSAKVFGMEVELPTRQPYQVIKELQISSFRIVIAKYSRREGGYLFPWRLMAFEPGSESFSFSYNLEITSLTCGLGSHTASGMHLTFEEGDPEMSFEEFEAWAIPLAMEQIASMEAKNAKDGPSNNADAIISEDQDSDVDLEDLEQAYDDGDIDYIEYRTKRNGLVMDAAANAYKSTHFDSEHAKNVIAYEDGDITLDQHLERFRALLVSEVTKVMMEGLDAIKQSSTKS